MKHRSIQAAVLAALLVLVLIGTFMLRPEAPSPGRPQPPATGPRQPEVIPGEYVVKFRTGIARVDRDATHQRANGRLVRRLSTIGVDVVSAPGDATAALAAYRSLPGVAAVEPNYVVRAAVVPNDPSYAVQWAMPKIRAPLAWDLTTGSRDVVIAIVDTGIDPTNPDLAANVLPGWNVLAGNNQPWDDNGHGTHVGSTAAAVGDDGVGVAGVAWHSKILPVKVLNAEGFGDLASAAAGIRWAVDQGARVINLSWGGPDYSVTLADEIAYARSRGAVLVAAAGNYASDRPFYPAALDGVIAVAATDQSDQIASFSNYGPNVALAAPGVDIIGAAPGGGYAFHSGTSMAAPHVAGTAALILSLRPGLPADQVASLLMSNAVDLGPAGWDDRYGAGRLDVFGAVQPAAGSAPIPTITPHPSPSPMPTPTATPTATATPTPTPNPFPFRLSFPVVDVG